MKRMEALRLEKPVRKLSIYAKSLHFSVRYKIRASAKQAEALL
jgi:hypothetical protein